MINSPDESNGLAALEAALIRDFQRLNHPPAEWVPPRIAPDGQPMVDVAIVGGGMCGLGAAFALRQLGISRIAHVDRRSAGLEGPWLTYARMQTLRSPKHLTGPVMGLPNLTFRAWWEAQGRDWDTLDRIARPDWMAYLRWYRRVTEAELENGVDVTRVVPHARHIEITLDGQGGPRQITARRLILATGREGQARPRIPAPLVPHHGTCVWHSADDIDFPALRGKAVAVLGLAASAFDNAATALEAGAASVTLIGRAEAMPRLNKMKQTVYPGFTHGFAGLPDADKLALLDHVMQHRIAPPRASVLRISSDPRARLMLGAAVMAARHTGSGLVLDTAKGALAVDAVILGTGFEVDLDTPSEIDGFADSILRWGDRVPEASGEWARFPYLGDDFSFRARDGRAGLDLIHCFTHSAQLSIGNLANDIPAVTEGAGLLARSIAKSLFVEDLPHHRQRLHDYADPELLGNEWPGLEAWDPPLEQGASSHGPYASIRSSSAS